MARATIKIIPNAAQLKMFGYSNDIDATWAYLADTFSGSKVECALDIVARPCGRAIGLWFDGICIPYEWCQVTHLTVEEKQILIDFKA